MINASAPGGVPGMPAQPVSGTPPVPPVSPVSPMTAAPGVPQAQPVPPVMPQASMPVMPGLSAPSATTPQPAAPIASFSPPVSATTPVTPSTAPAGSGTTSGSKLKPPGKKLPIKLIVGVGVLVLLLVGGIAAYLLSQTSQDVRQQASEPTYNDLCIAKYGGSAQLMAQEVTSCTNAGNIWDAVACSCNKPASTTPAKRTVYKRR